MVVASATTPYNKEIAIRRRISSIFNKREEDFPSLREYNDYLEEVEDMSKSNLYTSEKFVNFILSFQWQGRNIDRTAFVKATNLVEGIDVPVIEAKIAQYQEENAEQIMINRARKAEELAAALAASKGQPAQTDTDAAVGQSSQTGIGTGAPGHYAPTVPGGQPRPTGMAPQPIPVGVGPEGYAADDEEMMKLRAERGGRAGGWSIELSKRRAIEEAFGSIWI